MSANSDDAPRALSASEVAELVALAHGQQQLLDVLVAFTVCGLMGGRDRGTTHKLTLDAGIINQQADDGWVVAAQGAYQAHAAPRPLARARCWP